MLSTRGFAGRRRDVRELRPSPANIDVGMDLSVQHGEAFHADEVVGRLHHCAWRPRRISPGSGRSATRGSEVRSCSSRPLTSREIH
jgi:hypothetical protein